MDQPGMAQQHNWIVDIVDIPLVSTPTDRPDLVVEHEFLGQPASTETKVRAGRFRSGIVNECMCHNSISTHEAKAILMLDEIISYCDQQRP